MPNCFKSPFSPFKKSGNYVSQFPKGRLRRILAQNTKKSFDLLIKFLILFAFLCLFHPINALSLTPFFFDARAFPYDEDNDGGDEYIIVKFDVDLDEDITANVTVIATLYNSSDNAVSSKTITYPVTAQEQSYNELRLTPVPNVAGTYYVHLAFADSFDEMDIWDISYNPEPGSQPIAYFADVILFSELNGIQMDFDVNVVQQMTLGVKVEAKMMDSSGRILDTKSLPDYNTFYENLDYKSLSFTPPVEDLYSIALMVYPVGSGGATDSRLLNVISPPGTGAYFKKYDATVYGDSVKVFFDADMEYNVSYMVSVEAILYDSYSDPVAYEYTSYLTNGASNDEKSIILIPDQVYGDTYYLELVLYVEDYPASYGYVTDLPMGTHTLTATATNGGTLTPSGIVKVAPGTNQQFKITPFDGYYAVDVKVDGKSRGALNTYTFTDVRANHTIEAIFAINTYTITATASGGGTITPSDTMTVSYGSSKQFTIAPSDGYHIIDIKIDGKSRGALNTYTFTDVRANHTIEAIFSIDTYSITATANDGGTITPSDTVTVSYGSSKQFTIAPSDGYHIIDVKIDGESKGVLSTYTFSDVKSNHTVEAIFAINTYTITATAGNGGKIEPLGTVTVSYGSSKQFTITPSDGFHITDVKIDGESKGALTSHTFSDVKSDHTIDAIFAINTYTITATAGDGGQITPSGAVTVNYGSSQQFVIAPFENYYIADVKIDGKSKSILDSYKFDDVKTNHTIEATFAVAYVKGDVDGDGEVKSKDAFMVLSFLVQLINLTNKQILAADIDGNGIINTKDVIMIMQKSVGLIAPPKAYSERINLVLPKIHGVAGESIIVPVKIDRFDDLASGFISISYDSRILQAVEVNTAQDMLLSSNINNSGIIYIAFAANDKLNRGILSNVKFNVIADDVSPLKIINAEFCRTDTVFMISDKTDGFFSSWAKPADKDSLFQNFPNPFNPGTWIPYQLHNDSDVTITIYSEKGNRVNELKLGHKSAGIYTTYGRAAYWDGRNKSGEKVASGVYFYSIQAGNFTATRKMMVLE